MLWSTYIGESAWGNAIAVDGLGNILVGGVTLSNRAWVSGGYNTTFGKRRLSNRPFLAKIAPDGKHIWSTYLGMGPVEYYWCTDVGVDHSGNVLITGRDWYNTFVEKLSNEGDYLWSWFTSLRREATGEMYYELSASISTDSLDSVLVGGSAHDSGGARSRYPDVFIAKISEPRIIHVHVELAEPEHLTLSIKAQGFKVAALVVESVDSLAHPERWLKEDRAVIVENSPGVFEATLLRQGDTHFYRVRATH